MKRLGPLAIRTDKNWRTLPSKGLFLPARSFFLCALLFSFVLIAWLFLGTGSLLEAQAENVPENREYPIKAAYLYHFGRYIKWPPEAFGAADTPFFIGILGPNPFGNTLDQLARQKKVRDRPIVIKNFSRIEEYTRCHILFISGQLPQEHQFETIRRLSNGRVLLVGDQYAFAHAGGCIGFFLETNRVRFAINLEAMEKAQLAVSSKMLNLAHVIDPPARNSINSSSFQTKNSRR